MIDINRIGFFGDRTQTGYIYKKRKSDTGEMRYLTNLINQKNKFDNINNFILLQFTGLKDKNGKEIYEGDILTEDVMVANGNILKQYGTNKTWKHVYLVGFGKFNNDYCEECCGNVGFYLKCLYTLWSNKEKTDKNSRLEQKSIYFDVKNIEIIGNKFENPELLK